MADQVMLLPDGTEIHLIHFIYLSPPGVVAAVGRRLTGAADTWKIACVPNMTQFSASGDRASPWRRSEDVRAVTCPLCSRTEFFVAAERQLRETLGG